MPYSLPHVSLKEAMTCHIHYHVSLKEAVTPPPQKPILNLNGLHTQSSNHHHSSLHFHCGCSFISASFNTLLENPPSKEVVKYNSFSIPFKYKFQFKICHKHCTFLFELLHLTIYYHTFLKISIWVSKIKDVWTC